MFQTLEDASNGGVSEKHRGACGFDKQLEPETVDSPGHHLLRHAGERSMAVNLDDDVPLILTMEEGGGAPAAPCNSLGPEELPSKSEPGAGAGGPGSRQQ